MNMSTDTPIHPIYSNNKMSDIAGRFCDNRRYEMDTFMKFSGLFSLTPSVRLWTG